MSRGYNDWRFRRAWCGAEEVGVTNLARRVAESHGFQTFILGIILVTAVIVGLETSDALAERYGAVFELVDAVIQTIFVAGAFAMVARLLRVTRLELQAGEDRQNPTTPCSRRSRR